MVLSMITDTTTERVYDSPPCNEFGLNLKLRGSTEYDDGSDDDDDDDVRVHVYMSFIPFRYSVIDEGRLSEAPANTDKDRDDDSSNILFVVTLLLLSTVDVDVEDENLPPPPPPRLSDN